MPEAIEGDPIDGRVVEDGDADLDLDEEDAQLLEAIAQPMVVKVKGKLITVPHMMEWPHAASSAAQRSDYSAWATLVLSEADARTFNSLNLRNYQILRILDKGSARAGTTPGKILSLLQLAKEHGAALEADLQRYYQIDLIDFWRGKLTARKLDILLAALPPESATMTALRVAHADEEPAADAAESRPEDAPWSNLEMLAALIVDELRTGNYMTVAMHAKSPGKALQPLRRPGHARKKASRYTMEQRGRLEAQRQQFEEQRKRQAAEQGG